MENSERMFINDYQNQINEWSVRNFGFPVKMLYNIGPVLVFAQLVGRLAHHQLKASQGIRGSKADHEKALEQVARELQALGQITVSDGCATQPTGMKVKTDLSSFFGVVEEVGELAKAIYNEDSKEIDDAIADIMVYLLDFCGRNCKNAEGLLQYTWEKVRERDWKKNPNTAHQLVSTSGEEKHEHRSEPLPEHATAVCCQKFEQTKRQHSPWCSEVHD